MKEKKFTDNNFDPDYVNVVLKISDPEKPEEYKNIKVKLKPKGDRELQFMNLDSYVLQG